MTQQDSNSSEKQEAQLSVYNAIMGVGILADSEEIAQDFVTKLTELFSMTTEELSKLPKYADHIKILPPKESVDDTPGAV